GVSSQFLSGLLMAAPFASRDMTVQVDGLLVSEPYVAMTVRMMRQWGLTIEAARPDRFHVPAPQRPRPATGPASYMIEPDASAASYFFAAAAITHGRVTVPGLGADSLQGDICFVDVLEQMGCRVERETASLTVHGGPLHGIDMDMNDISDTVMTLGA